MNLGGIYLSVSAKTTKLKSDLAKAQGMTKKAAVLMNHEIKSVSFNQVKLAALVGVAALTAFTAKVVSVGRDFESTMKTVQAWSGATGDALKDLTDKAREMGATTEYTATEAAGALKFLAAAGFSAEESISALPGTLDLATAGQVDLAVATDITTDVLTAFGLNVEELGRVNDAFITTTSNSNTNVTMLGQSMKMVAPTAKLMGLSVEETAALLGTLANSGVKAEMAGSGLNMVLLKSQKAAKMLGMELDSSLIDVLERMKDEQWDAITVGEAFGARQIKTAGILMNNIGNYENLTKKIYENVGATQELAEIIRDSLDNDIKILNSTIEEELLRTFDKYNEYMRDIVQSTTEWIRTNPEAIDQFALFAKNMFEAAAAMAKIIGYIPKLTNGFISMWQAFGLASTGLITWREAIFESIPSVEKFNSKMGLLELQAKKLRGEIKLLERQSKVDFFSDAANNRIAEKTKILKRIELAMRDIRRESARMSLAVEDNYTDFGKWGDGLSEIAEKTLKETEGVTKKVLKVLQDANVEKYKMEIALAEQISDDTWLIREEGYKKAVEQAEDYITWKTQNDYDEEEKALKDLEKLREDSLKDSLKDLESLQKELSATSPMSFANDDLSDIANMINAVGNLTSAYENQARILEEINILRENGTITAIEASKLENIAGQKYLSETLSGYSNLFDTMANYYDEDSRARKTMNQLSLAFGAAEIAMETAKLIPIAAGAILNQATGDPYTAFARMAAMVGIVSGILSVAGAASGFTAGGGTDGSVGDAAPTATLATGTVLGYSSEISNSLKNSQEALEDYHIEEYTELQGIHDELVSLNTNITGLVSSLFIGGADFTGDMGLNLGFDQSGLLISGWAGEISNWLISGIFGGGTESSLLRQGITTGSVSISDLFGGEQIDVTQFADIFYREDGGWFSGDDTWKEREFQDLGESVDSLFTKVFLGLSETMVSLGEILGQDASAIEAYVFDIGDIDLTNLETADEISEALNAAFSGITDTAAEALFGDLIGQYQSVGEGMLETAERVASELIIIEDIVGTTNQAFVGTTAEAIAFTQAVIDIAGGFDTLYDSFTTFYDKFFSDVEKQADILETLTSSLTSIPEARDDYRSAIQAIDLSTESGKELYATMLNLSELADEYYSYLEDQIEQTDSFVSSINDTIAELTMSDFDFSVYNLDKWYNEQAASAEELGIALDDLDYVYGLQLAILKDLTEEIEDLTDDIDAFNLSISEIIFKSISTDLEYAIYELDKWYAEQSELATELGQSLDYLNWAYALQLQELKDLTEEIDDFNLSISELIYSFIASDLEYSVYELNKWYAEQAELAEELGQSLDYLNWAYALQLQELKELALETARNNYIDSLSNEISLLQEEYYLLEEKLSDAKDAYLTALENEIDIQGGIVYAAENAADALENVIEALEDAMSITMAESLLNPAEALQFAGNQYSAALSSAMAGDITSLENLPGLASDYLSAAQSAMTDRMGYQSLATLIYTQLSGAKLVAEDQLTEQEQLIKAAEEQTDILNSQVDAVNDVEESILSLIELEAAYNQAILDFETSGLDAQMEIYQSMLDELENININILSLTDAEAAYTAATIVAMDPGTSLEESYLAAKAQQANEAIAAGDATVLANLAAFGLSTTSVTADDIASAFAQSGLTAAEHYAQYGQYEDIPGFADGGTITGPSSGYTIPTTFHGTEHITPDSEMTGVKKELAGIKKILLSILNVDADNGDFLYDIVKLYKRNMKGGTNFRTLVVNPISSPVRTEEVP